jgi:hypothetical protein
MPTFEYAPTFAKDIEVMDRRDLQRFKLVVTTQFVADLAGGTQFRGSLRVKGVRRVTGVFEMTWAPDGRATFEFGNEIVAGEAHIIWRRVGTHEIFRSP